MGFTKSEIWSRYTLEQHREFMSEAIAAARDAALVHDTGGAFGAVVVKEGRIVGRGQNRVVAMRDPTWHGEMEAIRDACSRLQSFSLRGCILYSSGECCPMCLAGAYWARLDGMVYGATCEDARIYGNFDDSFIQSELAKPADQRVIPQINLMRDDVVEVWKAYAAKPDRVPY